MVAYHKMVRPYHLTLLNIGLDTGEKIVTQVLNLSKKHQEGRVTEKVTHVTFDFIK